MTAAAKTQTSAPVVPEIKSHAERAAEHATTLAALTKVRDKDRAAAQREIQKAEAAYTKATTEVEVSHAAVNRSELERSRATAIEALARAIEPWRKGPTRTGTEAILKAWQAADADARHATGAPIHDEVIAYAFAAVMIAEDPDAVRAFAEHNALTAPSLTTQPLAHQAYYTSKILASGDLLEIQPSLELLERAVNAVARRTRACDLEAAKARWAVITLRSSAELEEFDRANEVERQKTLCAQIKPQRPKHPVDYSGSLVQTEELRSRIAAGKTRAAVYEEAMRENAGLAPLEPIGP